MSLGGEGGGLKYPLPPYEIFPQNFRKKMAFLKKFLTFFG